MKAIFNRIRAANEARIAAPFPGSPAPDAGRLKKISGFDRTQTLFQEARSTKYWTKGDTS